MVIMGFWAGGGIIAANKGISKHVVPPRGLACKRGISAVSAWPVVKPEAMLFVSPKLEAYW